jgi:hypothetical protein
MLYEGPPGLQSTAEVARVLALARSPVAEE